VTSDWARLELRGSVCVLCGWLLLCGCDCVCDVVVCVFACDVVVGGVCMRVCVLVVCV